MSVDKPASIGDIYFYYSQILQVHATHDSGWKTILTISSKFGSYAIDSTHPPEVIGASGSVRYTKMTVGLPFSLAGSLTHFMETPFGLTFTELYLKF